MGSKTKSTLMHRGDLVAVHMHNNSTCYGVFVMRSKDDAGKVALIQINTGSNMQLPTSAPLHFRRQSEVIFLEE